jgi:hypothetical protein
MDLTVLVATKLLAARADLVVSSSFLFRGTRFESRAGNQLLDRDIS